MQAMSICRDKRLPPRAEVQMHTHGNKRNIWAPLWAAGHAASEQAGTMQISLCGHCVGHPACITQAPTQQAPLSRASQRAQHRPGLIPRGGIGFPRSETADQDVKHTHTHANFSCCPFYHSGKSLVTVNHRKRA